MTRGATLIDDQGHVAAMNSSSMSVGPVRRITSARVVSFILLALLICLGAGLRLRGIDLHTISGDEQSSVWYAARGLCEGDPGKQFPAVPWLKSNIIAVQQPFTQKFYADKMKLRYVLKSVAQSDGGNGLCYSLLLHFWIWAFGAGDVIVRLPSLFFGVACIPVAYGLARSLGCNRGMALLAAALTALHPQLILFSQIARNYAMATCLSLLSTFFFMRLFDKHAAMRVAVGYWLFTTLSLLTHYLTAYVFVGHFIAATLFFRSKRQWTLYGGALTGTMCCLATWLLFSGAKAYALLQAQNMRLTGLMINHNPAYTWVKPFNWTNLCSGWWQQLCFITGALPYPCPSNHIVELLVAACLLIGVALGTTLLVFGKRLTKWQNTSLISAVTLLILTLTAPALATYLSLKNGHILAFIPRYAIFSVPYCISLLAVCLSPLFRWSYNRNINIALASFGSLLILQMMNYSLVVRRVFDEAFPASPNPYFALAKTIQLRYKTNDIVVFPSWIDAATVNAYLPAEPVILQKVDPALKTKVLLIPAGEQAIPEIFDLQGNVFPSII